MALCLLCQKSPVHGKNIPKSVHKTSKISRPNLQKVNGVMICTRCARTLRKYEVALV